MLYCLFHLFQVLAPTHEILHLSIANFLTLSLVLLHDVVGSDYLLCTYFQLVGGLDFDEVVSGRFHM